MKSFNFVLVQMTNTSTSGGPWSLKICKICCHVTARQVGVMVRSAISFQDHPWPSWGNMTTRRYIEVLQPVALIFAVFQQDNGHPHTAAICKNQLSSISSGICRHVSCHSLFWNKYLSVHSFCNHLLLLVFPYFLPFQSVLQCATFFYNYESIFHNIINCMY